MATSATSAKSILILNDDCLYTILSHFSIQELIPLEKVCDRFSGVAKMIYRKEEVLDFCEIATSGWDVGVTALEAKEISRRVGPFVHTLRASRNSFRMTGRVAPKSMLQFCTNLQEIHLFDMRLSDAACMRRLNDTLRTIKKVHLEQCTFTDDIGACLRNSTQLEIVSFERNQNITGECLVGLKGIKKINLESCKKLKPQFLRQFCEANPQLQSLNINNCPEVDGAFLKFIATKLINLEALMIGDNYNARGEDYHALADLPKVTHLKIGYNRKVRYNRVEQVDGFFLKMCEKAHDRLEVLELNGSHLVAEPNLLCIERFTNLKILNLNDMFCRDSVLDSIIHIDKLEELHIAECKLLTPDCLVNFIARCNSLKFIDISRCFQYTNDFLHAIEPHVLGRVLPLKIVAKKSLFCLDQDGEAFGVDQDDQDLLDACDPDVLRLILARTEGMLEFVYKDAFDSNDEILKLARGQESMNLVRDVFDMLPQFLLQHF